MFRSRQAVHHAIATSTDHSVMLLVGKGSKRRIEWCVFGVKCLVCYNIQKRPREGL